MKRYGAVYFQPLEPQPAVTSPQSSVISDAQTLAFELAGAFSPWVEMAGPNLALMDLSGLTKQWPEEKNLAHAIQKKFEEQDLRAQVAIASNQITARLAALGYAGISIVAPRQEKQFLAPLSLELLEPPPELEEVFERWGLRTLGDLARLPEHSLAQRLGGKGMELYYHACGKDGTPLHPFIPAETFEACYAFDWPLENSESLAFILNHLLDRLCGKLASKSLRAEAIDLSLELADRTKNERLLRFGFPLNDPATILSLLRLDLTTRPPQAAIVSLQIRFYPTPPRPMQFSLIDPPLPAPEKLARTLARLAALVGEQNVGSPALLNTHRSDAFQMLPFQPHVAGRKSQVESPKSKVASRRSKVEGQRSKAKAPNQNNDLRLATCDLRLTHDLPAIALSLRIFRPPLQAQVVTEQLQPVAIRTSKIRGRVLEYGGPWHSSGDWWEDKQRWAKEDWDVLLSNGGIYRIYRDLNDERWFIYGAYD